MKDVSMDKRYRTIVDLLPGAVKNARQYAEQPVREFIEKADGSKVGPMEAIIDEHSERCILERFPGDSVICEERKPIFSDRATFCFFQDPLDGTHEAIRSGIKYDVLTVLQAYTEYGKPFAFGVGEIVSGKLFTGNLEDGIFLDGVPYVPPHQKERFLLWVKNENEKHAHIIQNLTGLPTVQQAGTAIRLLLYGHLAGGINVYENVYEVMCFEAAVRTLGGTISVIRAPTMRYWQVFSLPGVDHREVLDRAEKSIWEMQ